MKKIIKKKNSACPARNWWKKIKEFIKQGNIRRIIIKNEKGETLIEIPLTIAVVGAIIVPVLAAVGGIAAIVTNCTVIIERK